MAADVFVVVPKLELELILSHMTQKPVLRGEVGCACVAREVSVVPCVACNTEEVASHEVSVRYPLCGMGPCYCT